MKLLFLGTGPAIGIPRPGHNDPACQDARAGGKSRRRRSAAIISHGIARILIDAGPDIEKQLDEANPDHLDAVVLTHGHADAAGGIAALARWHRRRCKNDLLVFTDAHTRRRILAAHKTLPGISIRAIRAFETLAINGLSIVPVPVEHSVTPGFPTYGFVFNKRLGYASDVSDIPPQTQRLFSHLPTLILDAAFFFGTHIPSHLNTEAAIAWGSRLRVRRLFLTQIGHSYPPHAEAVHRIRAFVKTLPKEKTSRVVLAYDGMVMKE